MMDLMSCSSVQFIVFGVSLLLNLLLCEERRGFSGLCLFWASLGLCFSAPRSVFTVPFPTRCLATGP